MRCAFLSLTMLAFVCCHGQELLNHWWTTDGRVNAIAIDTVMLRVYVGGDFHKVGKNSPHLSVLDPLTGEVIPGWPYPDLPARQVIPDGTGGCLAIGSFSRIGGIPREKFARINADGFVHPLDIALIGTGNSTPRISAMAVKDSLLFIGGSFSLVNGTDRFNLAAVHLETGIVLPFDLPVNSQVTGMCIAGDTLLISGSFTSVSGTAVSRAAAISISSGQLLNWFPLPPQAAFKLMVKDTAVYMASNNQLWWHHRLTGAMGYTCGFSAIGEPGSEGSALMDFDINDTIAIAVGAFNASCGPEGQRNAIMFDLRDWTVTPFTAPTILGYARTVAIKGDTAFIGGEFLCANGNENLIALRLSTGAILPYAPQPNSLINRLAMVNGKLVAAGDHGMMNCVNRAHLCELDAITGSPTPWHPNPSHPVHALLVHDSSLYAGGSFASFAGQPRPRLARVNLSTHQVRDEFPACSDGTVYALHARDQRLFVGGSFSELGSLGRLGLAAIDLPTESVTDWNPSVIGAGVYSLSSTGSVLYAGGGFIEVGSEPRLGAAAFDLASGAVLPWSPALNGVVFAIAPAPEGICIGGYGNNVHALVRIDPDDGSSVSNMGIPASSVVRAIVHAEGKLYAGGSFTSVGNAVRHSLARFDLTSETLDPWSPEAKSLPPISPWLSHTVNALAKVDTLLFVGGTFRSIGDLPRHNFAVLRLCDFNAYYPDMDGDGLGNPALGIIHCGSAPAGFVTDASDCNDLEAGAHIGDSCDDGNPNTVNDAWQSDCTCTGDFATAIPSTTRKELNAWPIPVQEELHLSTSVDALVLDVHGRIVSAVRRSRTIPVVELQPGVYVLRTSDGIVLRFLRD